MTVHDSILAEIQVFLAAHTITNLIGGNLLFPDQQYMKAGVVPFIRHSPAFSYLMMKPVSKRGNLAPPDFQFCKGTRMYLRRGSGWRDMKAGDEGVEDKELLPVTALREGIEELGLKLNTIISLHDVGPYKFTSERTGKSKYMWLYAAELPAQHELLPMEAIATATAERGWMTEAEFVFAGRTDHRYILTDIAAKLAAHYP